VTYQPLLISQNSQPRIIFRSYTITALLVKKKPKIHRIYRPSEIVNAHIHHYLPSSLPGPILFQEDPKIRVYNASSPVQPAYRNEKTLIQPLAPTITPV
jgi:hypothetical protein